MAETNAKQTAADLFTEHVRIVRAGMKELEAAGVPAPQAATIAVELWHSCKEQHRMSQYEPKVGRVPNGGFSESPRALKLSTEEQKRHILELLKGEAKTLGITRDDLAAIHNEEEGGATQGSKGQTEGGRPPEQLHGDKTETAETRTDNTNPGAGNPKEPTTGAPPKTEPETGPKKGTHH